MGRCHCSSTLPCPRLLAKAEEAEREGLWGDPQKLLWHDVPQLPAECVPRAVTGTWVLAFPMLAGRKSSHDSPRCALGATAGLLSPFCARRGCEERGLPSRPC